MTAWSLLIAASTQSTREEFVEMAREGERLLVALGGARPSPDAATLTASTDRAQWDAWTDRYQAAAEGPRAMPLSVLFAGVSGWDFRADRLISSLTSTTPPTWQALRAVAANRVLPAGVGPSFDWFASRGEPMDRGDELQQLASKSHRAWWADTLNRFAVGTGRAPTPGRPPTPGAPSSGGGGGFLLLLLILGARAMKRRRG